MDTNPLCKRGEDRPCDAPCTPDPRIAWAPVVHARVRDTAGARIGRSARLTNVTETVRSGRVDNQPSQPQFYRCDCSVAGNVSKVLSEHASMPN
jgi:hypothetical protein